MPTAVYHRSTMLAHAALAATVEGDFPRAEALLAKLPDEGGPDGLRYACMTWCDSLIEHVYGEQASSADLVLGLALSSPAERARAAAPGWFDWASRVVRARAAGDATDFRAAIAELGDATIGEYPPLLLSAIAYTMRTQPRGDHRRTGDVTVPAAVDEAVEAILLEHSRNSIVGCRCGWSDLGRSHLRHLVAVLREAGLLADNPAQGVAPG